MCSTPEDGLSGNVTRTINMLFTLYAPYVAIPHISIISREIAEAMHMSGAAQESELQIQTFTSLMFIVLRWRTVFQILRYISGNVCNIMSD